MQPGFEYLSRSFVGADELSVARIALIHQRIACQFTLGTRNPRHVWFLSLSLILDIALLYLASC
jgi:hypothetical protein